MNKINDQNHNKFAPTSRANNKTDNKSDNISFNKIHHSLFLSVSEAAKIGGVQTKTIRRAIKSNSINYKIVNNRYSVQLESLITYLHSKTKLKNKLKYFGIGQYIERWKS